MNEIRKTKLNVVSIGTTPMTRKINLLLEQMQCINLCGIVNLNPEKFSQRSNFEAMYDFKLRRPNDIFYTEDINDSLTIEWINERQPDIILQSGWSQIWKKQVLEIPKKYCVGIHAAPLPEGRGAAILNWKIIEGGGPWGNSLFVMEEKTDMGDILDFEPFEIEPRDDVRTAYLKADRTALTMLNRTLPKILDGTVEAMSQAGKKGSRYYKRTPKDGLIEFEWEASTISNYVRALTHPYPGAFFNTVFGKIVVWSCEAINTDSEKSPGTVLEIRKGKGLLVKTSQDSAIWLLNIEPENDIEVWADIWANECNITPGHNLIIKRV